MTAISGHELKAMFADTRWEIVEPDESVGAALRRGRLGTELWSGLLAFLLVLLVGECALVWLFSPRRVDATEMLASAQRL